MIEQISWYKCGKKCVMEQEVKIPGTRGTKEKRESRSASTKSRVPVRQTSPAEDQVPKVCNPMIVRKQSNKR